MSGYYHYIGAAPLAPSPYYVLLATPAAEHPECNHSKSMVATVETLVRAGIQFDFMMVQGSCHVDDVRNGIIRDFLQHRRPPSESEHCRYTYTDLFFLDADMGWDAKSLIDLLQAPGDIVAGVYRHKNDTETYPFDAGQFEGLAPNDNRLFEMPKVATGFMRVRREVLQKLYDLEGVKGRISWANPQDRQKNPLGIARIVERGWPRELGIPEEIHAGNDYQSGDYMMCLKARRAGFHVFADPDMKFTHAGSKVWIGHFGNHLRLEQGVVRQELIEAVDALKAGDASLETFVRLREGYSLDPSRNAASSFALTAEMMKELWDRAKQAKAPVLEMGSGLSTLVLALALEGTGQTGHALENDLLSWRRTNAMLERFEARNVLMYYTPLEPIGPKSNDVAYAETDLPDSFGLVLIDGPYHSPQRSRAVWALRKRVKDACLLIDDVDTCDALMTMLSNAGYGFEIKEGARKWAIATPKASVPAAAHTLSGKLVVSLTSHPPRFPMLKRAVESILSQDMKPDETVLWLAQHELAALPPEILRMDGLTIRQCEDLRSYKKLIPALEHYPEAYILTADDDVLYPRTWVRGIVEAYRNPKEILLYRGRAPHTTETGELTSYNRWPNVWRETGVFPTSCHGMLVPPGAMAPRVMDREAFTRLCPMNDDIWWWWMGLMGGSTFRVIHPIEVRDLPTGHDGLWSQHNRDGGNDRQIAAMIQAYGMPWRLSPAGVAAIKEAAE